MRGVVKHFPAMLSKYGATLVLALSLLTTDADDVVAQLTVSAGIARSQQLPPLMEGETIRVSYCVSEAEPGGFPAAHCTRAQGTVQRVAADTVVIGREPAGESLTIPFAWVTELEVSHGYRSRVLACVTIAGMVAAIVIADPNGSNTCYSETTECVLFAVASVGVGALVGLILSGEDWEEVPLDLLRLSVEPQRDGRLGVGLSLAF